jgi:hypothetical protein
MSLFAKLKAALNQASLQSASDQDERVTEKFLDDFDAYLNDVAGHG